MDKLNAKLVLSGLAVSALLMGCGAGNSNVEATAPVTPAPVVPAPDLATSVSAVIDYIGNLIANFGENTDPVNVNSVTLAVDDTEEPTGLK